MTASEYARKAGHFELEAFLERHADKQAQRIASAPYTGAQAGAGVLASAAGPTTASEQLTLAAGDASSNATGGSSATGSGVSRSIIPGAALSRSSRRPREALRESAPMRTRRGAGAGSAQHRMARSGARALEDGEDEGEDEDEDEDEEEDYYVVDPLGTMMASMPDGWAAQLGGGQHQQQMQLELGASDRERDDDWHASAEGAAVGVRLAPRGHSPPLPSMVCSSAPRSPAGSVGSHGGAGAVRLDAAPRTKNRWRDTQAAGVLYDGVGSRRMDEEGALEAGSSGSRRSRSGYRNPHGYELDPGAFVGVREDE